jgi:opacity protein-like surface antigen
MLRFGLAVAALGLCAMPAANAAGLYGRLEAGIYSGNASGIITDVPLGLGALAGTNPNVDTDTGFAGFAVLGLDLVGGFRLEGELGLGSASLSADTDVSELTVMANALYALDIAPSIDLVFGAGLGFSNYDWDAFPVFSPAYEGSDSGFAYQAIAGLEMELGDGMALGLRYRYRATEVDMPAARVPAGTANVLATLDGLDSHIVTVGLSFDF